MSNLPGKIMDTYFSKEEQHTYSRFFKLLLRFLLVTFGGAAFIQIVGSFSLFYFGEFTDLVCAILTCILTGKAPASNDNTPQ